jgi:primosomal protein N' (replication factor Y)
MCRDCGHVLVCPNCHSSLVIHYHEPAPHERRTAASAASERDRMLVCHSCSYRAVVPAFCPQCLSPRMKSFGVGTQQVEHEVHTLFPHARTLRWDRDSASQRGAHERLFQQFLHHEADVLVGTQMIAKGFDLPLVSLVGVVAADTALHLPDFRSGERTFQLLTQVAGRAGRRSAGAQVVIQSYTPEHYALRAAQEHDYHAFYQHEIAFRRQTGYPPFSRLVRFLYTSKSRAACQRTAHELATQIAAIIEQQHRYGWGIIGPAPSLLRRRGQWRWHLLLRIPAEEYSDQALASLLAALGPIYGWVLDRDPLHVL